MRVINYNSIGLLFISICLMTIIGCKHENFEELELASFPVIAEVFDDTFSNGLDYFAFEDSKLDAFDVDIEIVYEGEASMRFDVPDPGQTGGGYAGGAFITDIGRDLTSFNALTFWAKSSAPGNIDVIGFGNDFEESSYEVSIREVAVNSGWSKYFIPIPDPSKLTQERGMFYYAEGPENDRGYSFWIDEVKFEYVEGINSPNPGILNYQDQTIIGETGQKIEIEGLVETFTLPSGAQQVVNVAPAYFEFQSSNPSVAIVEDGMVCVFEQGSADISANLTNLPAGGLLTIQSTGPALLPQTAAPVPTVDAQDVISLYSNAYNNVPVDVWNTYWMFSTAESTDTQVDGDDIIRYTNLNFVGIEFVSQTINISSMTHFHIDIWTPDPTALPAAFNVLLVDFGANNTFDGGDDSSHEVSFTSPTLATETWVSLDIPLSNFTGLTGRSNLAQLVLSGDLPYVFIDNVYFYAGEGGSTETIDPAPMPSQSADQVLSIFSDAYVNVEGTDFYPDWGQSTSVSEQLIESNTTLVYSNFNYQGIQLGANQNISTFTNLHLDVYSESASEFNIYLISPGPVEVPYSIAVPTDGWLSLDIPLTEFSPVDLNDLFQLKFDGMGDQIFIDNIYFYN